MNTKTAQDMERSGKVIAIAGVILFGASLIGHLYYKGRLNAIISEVNNIDFNSFSVQSQYNSKIKPLESEQESCENRPQLPNVNPFGNTTQQFDDEAFFRCREADIQKRAAEIADLKAQLQNQIQELRKPLPVLYRQGDQENFKTQLFFYSSIVTLVMTVIGLLLIFGRSLAFINRGGDISIGDIHNSKIPINSGQENTAVAGDTISNLSVEKYSNSVKNSISHIPANSNDNTEQLKKVLAQIQELITTSSDLSNEKKLMALEQVNILTEASANPTNPNKRKVADQAIMVLRGIASSLPQAAQLAEALSKLLPSVISLLGLS